LPPTYTSLDGGGGLILLHFIGFKRRDFLAGLPTPDIRLDCCGCLLFFLSHTSHLLTYRQSFFFFLLSAPGQLFMGLSAVCPRLSAICQLLAGLPTAYILLDGGCGLVLVGLSAVCHRLSAVCQLFTRLSASDISLDGGVTVLK
jgi:hypothetical protein